MANEEQRVEAASLLRELGHDFVAHELGAGQLAELSQRVRELLALVRAGELRQRARPSGAVADFRMAVPQDGQGERHQLFSDSIVSGGANPMGLGAYLGRDGETSVMQVTLGKAFEGAPGRAHGGIVAALIDETMGLALAINGLLAFTAQLDITYVAPTPINEALTARAWLEGTRGRKYTIAGTVHAGDALVARAKGLFISVDPTKFLAHLPALDS